MVEVAPSIFIGSWDWVQVGYLHPGGVFIIRISGGHEYQVHGKENIAKTIEIWRNRFPELRQESVREDVPEEISFWLGKARREKRASQEG